MGLSIKAGDTVLVISGRNKGAVGKILARVRNQPKAVVEGVNMIKRHTKARSQQQPGGIIEKEAAIHISNLMLVDPKTGRASRYSSETTKAGGKIRRSKATGNEV